MARKKKADEEEEALEVGSHFLVPKHERLSGEEAHAVLEKFHATPSQMPYILSTDPMVKELKAVPGDVIRITRKSETAGEAIYYRYVVEA